jgi:hypothetical protein
MDIRNYFFLASHAEFPKFWEQSRVSDDINRFYRNVYYYGREL